MLAQKQSRRFVEPFITAHDRISSEFLHQGLDFRRGREFGELHEGREPRVQIGITHDAAAEEELLPARIVAERADRVAAEHRILRGKRGQMRRLVELPETLQRPQRVNRADRAIVRDDEFLQAHPPRRCVLPSTSSRCA